MTITASVTGPVTDSDESHAPISECVNVTGVSQKASLPPEAADRGLQGECRAGVAVPARLFLL